MREQTEELLILTKTYPMPSGSYRETTCVAAINRDREWRRLYPVPFRLLAGDKQFKKWEWIRARVSRRSRDQRPESRRIDCDSIERLGVIETDQGWMERRSWFEPLVVDSAQTLEQCRQTDGVTLGILRVDRFVALDISPCKQPHWTRTEITKLRQDGLFDDEATRTRAPLRKVPYEFRLEYEVDTASGTERNSHLITDWEIGALYWNCVRRYKIDWEIPLRRKIEDDLATRDLHVLLGTVHRHPNVWIAAGLIYPPRQGDARQLSLELE